MTDSDDTPTGPDRSAAFDGLEGTALQVAFRQDLLESLRLELLGPAEDDELLLERPSLRYMLGRLAPSGVPVSQEEDEGNADVDDEEGQAADVPTVLAMNPSSVGLSVVLEPGVGTLRVTASWGEYAKEKVEVQAAEEHEDGTTTAAKHRTGYRRTSRLHTTEVMLDEEDHEIAPGVVIMHRAERMSDGRTAVSMFLLNAREARDADRPDEDEWLFQPVLSLAGVDGRAVFGPRVIDEELLSKDPDLVSAELVYWNRPEIAVGHGCAADWDPPAGHLPVAVVSTEIMPVFELPRVDPRDDAPGTLDMRALGGDGPAGLGGTALASMLRPMAAAYEQWISDLEVDVLPGLREQVGTELWAKAGEHLERARIAAERIAEGIDLLETDDLARRAFCFANRAMALQRARSVVAMDRRRGLPQRDVAAVPARWRPFQLAFILLNLPSCVDRAHSDRGTADLLWFPTGGGKTEAYLGLTAFTLAHRRIRPGLHGLDKDAGVSVLMRYTLRLLTLQQFQRATTLVCACEHLRAGEGVWGDTPFSIGLWVGQSATPNSFADAEEGLRRLREGRRPEKGSPVQLVSCPWCGTTIGLDDHRADKDRKRVDITCPDTTCDFSAHGSGRLPVHVVDEEIYSHVPSLVIATVDKFARMPWKGQVQTLFGKVNRHCPNHGYLAEFDTHPNRHRETWASRGASVSMTSALEPPDLIIQDELHLISGPLGTLVGIYETAVELLSSVRVGDVLVGPKVIASTATIRSATDQVNALFSRKVEIFPPQGLESTDSWFGKEVPVSSQAPGRLYVGVHAPGKSVKTALVRVYAAMLSRAQRLREVDAEAADAYMTLVGYFNSLRELGGALRLVEDDIPARMKVLNGRDKDHWAWRRLFEREELTSNKTAEQVPDVLAKMERPFTDEQPETGRYPVDTLLASNMISVGVDIDRLGLMVVNGQPKTTAEYIQATSRVGRRAPGLVLTTFNWTRPRDISHYERFRSYHQMLYRFVEPTSVTPFSSRARDRALDGVLTALVRLGDPAMTAEDRAGEIDRSDAWILELVELIADRAERVSPDGGDGSVGSATRDELLARLDRWSDEAGQHDLRYTKWGMSKSADEPQKFLLGPSEQEHAGEFSAPGSLREVEAEVHVYIPQGAVR